MTTVTQGFWHCIKPWSRPYLNIIYTIMNVRDTIVDPNSIDRIHWINTRRKCALSTFKYGMYQHVPFRSYQCIDDLLWWPILMWGFRTTKHNIFLLLQHIPHNLWVIEYQIFSAISLDHHYLTLRLPPKYEFLKYPTCPEHQFLWVNLRHFWYSSIYINMNFSTLYQISNKTTVLGLEVS